MPPRPPSRLVMVTHEFSPFRGGIAVYAAEIVTAAAALGHVVEVWAPALPPGQSEPTWPFIVRRLPIDGTHSLRNQWIVTREFLRQREYLRGAILYVPEPGPLFSLMLLQLFHRLPSCPLLITLHGSEILAQHARPFLRWRTRLLLTHAKRVGVVSQYAHGLLKAHFPSAMPKTVLSPGALRANFHSAASRSSAPSPDQAGRKIIILTVARLHPRKGQRRVIEALDLLPPALKSRIEYWLVGSHPKAGYESVLHEAAEQAGYPVKFLGDVPDEKLGAIYAQADIFALTPMPHRHSVEGFGLVYLEAGAHALPVVAHAIGGVSEAVAQNETGLLVSPDEPAALTAALAQLINDPSLRHRLGEAGRHRARRHTWRENALTLFGLPATDSPA